MNIDINPMKMIKTLYSSYLPRLLICNGLKFENVLSKRLLQTSVNVPRINSSGAGRRIADRKKHKLEQLCDCDKTGQLGPCTKSINCQYKVDQVPVFIKTYGCQMNLNDSAIVKSILEDYGYKIVDDEYQAEIYLLMTCAIRDSAEDKVWKKLTHLKNIKDNRRFKLEQIGLLGCMAERIKDRALDIKDGCVDIVAGPDSYRDLPRLFGINRLTNDKVVNCLLSLEETYSEIRPVTNVGEVTTYVSITRGCDNLCSYCIVPYTRGRERSRPLTTIIDEIKIQMQRGIKDVTLLGQNVNSYRDTSTEPSDIGRLDLMEIINEPKDTVEGFKTVYKPKQRGLSFEVLLEEVAKISPELRIRFTSPHPKDFTDDVIEVMAKYPNICRNMHLPAQAGSNPVLERMRRGYTREAYLELVRKIRSAIPDMALTSDFITGYCGETEEDHLQTIDLINQVKYNFIYVFPYSQRDKTHAYYNYPDDVPNDVKLRRSNEIAELFRKIAQNLNENLIGTDQLVLIDSVSKRSKSEWRGRTSNNIKTILTDMEVEDVTKNELKNIKLGDYVLCRIQGATSESLRAWPLYITSQKQYFDSLAQKNDHELRYSDKFR